MPATCPCAKKNAEGYALEESTEGCAEGCRGSLVPNCGAEDMCGTIIYI